jgi:hypothetical protein
MPRGEGRYRSTLHEQLIWSPGGLTNREIVGTLDRASDNGAFMDGSEKLLMTAPSVGVKVAAVSTDHHDTGAVVPSTACAPPERRSSR